MRKSMTILTAACLAVLFVVPALGGPGGADDPLVTVAYLKEMFTDKINGQITQKANDMANGIVAQVDQKLTQADGKVTADGVIKAAVKASVAKKIQGGALDGSATLTLNKGEELHCKMGTTAVILSGDADVFGVQGDVLNLTRGSPANVGTAAPRNTTYFFIGDAGGMRATTAGTKILVTGSVDRGQSYQTVNGKYAQVLSNLGVFRGTDNGFDLDKKGDRIQGLIMLIRLFGLESEALKHSGTHPFIDLNLWADGHKYVGYGFEKGLTNGTNSDNTTFEASTLMSGDVYFTFVLRALGYDDKKGDFSWQTAREKAIEVGLTTQAALDQINQVGLYRDHIVKISYDSLGVKIKGGSQTLGQKLIAQGVFTQTQLSAAATYVLNN